MAARLQLKGADGTRQRAGLLLQRLGRCGRFFDQCRVLLRHLVHLHHGLIDLLNASGLLLAGGSNLAHDVGDALDTANDVLHGFARFADQSGAGADFAGRVSRQSAP